MLLVALPPVPHYRGYPLGRAESFRRAKSEWRSAVSSGPLGPDIPKIAVGPIPRPRLAFLSQRSWFCSRRRGDPCGRPQAFPWGKDDSPYQGEMAEDQKG